MAFETIIELKSGDCHYSVDTLQQLFRFLPSWLHMSSLYNQQSLVEVLRLITEVVIWGDQHDPELFTFFRKEDGLRRLLRVLRWRSNRRGPVAAQMLQTFAMLVQNIRDQHTLTYILKHEAIREIISLDFDFSDEEVVGYYVSFVKTIAFQLNQSTIGSFIRRSSPKSNAYTMPLFMEAIRFISSPERMVRSAARTLTLTVMGLKNDVIDRFLISDENRSFFKVQVKNLSIKIHELDQLSEISEPEKKTVVEIGRLTAEIEDDVCYLNDIYSSGSKQIQTELANAVWDYMLSDYLIQPLFDTMNQQLLTATRAHCMSGEGYSTLPLPKVETLMSIASKWVPLRQSDFHRSIITTFVASTMNVLLRDSDFIYCRVLMQLINQAFYSMDKSVHKHPGSLLGVDLETLDFNDNSHWRTETTKTGALDVGAAVQPLEFADIIGLDVCFKALTALFQRTSCAKYKPCCLMKSLARGSRLNLKGHQSFSSTQSDSDKIRSSMYKSPVHRRFHPLFAVSVLEKQGRTKSF